VRPEAQRTPAGSRQAKLSYPASLILGIFFVELLKNVKDLVSIYNLCRGEKRFFINYLLI